MSTISPSTTLASNELLANKSSPPDQPSANFVTTANPTRPANGNGVYPKPAFPTGPKRSEQGKRLSLEAYLGQYAADPDFNYEWNAGILEEKPVSTIAQLRLYRWFLQILSYYLEVNHLAEAAMFEFLTEMETGDKTGDKTGSKIVKRKPDLLIVRNDNPIPLHDDDESYAGVCDLCVELLSTSNQANIDRDIKVKKAEYAAAGVHEYLILDRDGDHMQFYRLAASGEYAVVQADPAGIVTFESLPGFQFRWADLVLRPPLRTLVEDPVYNHYILPEYEMLKRRVAEAEQRAAQETQRAEQEAQRAEQAAQRAEQEAQRAEWYAAQLRAHGIDLAALPKSY